MKPGSIQCHCGVVSDSETTHAKHLRDFHGPKGKKWEYTVHTLSPLDDTTVQDNLNEWGSEGWELVCIEARPITCTFYFKRPKVK